ncbi:MAG: MFS transporter [Anaerolineae bacterium]|nr:MFS transporter [Anaerolineae bacterium]
MKKSLFLIFAFVFIDVLGFSLILPLLPFYAQSFEASETVVGLLLAANAVTQMVGAPTMGRLSDRYGRKPLLLVSLIGTVVGFVLLGSASALWMLFLSRIIDGLFGGNISLAQAYITDVTDEKNRSKGLGLIGASFGLGFIFGPALGGTLSAGSNYALPAFVAAGLAALNLIAVQVWLPESLTEERRQNQADSPRSAFSLRQLWEALRLPCVGPLLNIRLWYGLAFTMFQTIFSLYAAKRLGLDARATSYVLTYVGILIVLIQGGGIGQLTKRFTDKQLLFGSSVLLAFSLLAWAVAPNLVVLLIVLAPLALASSVMNVTSNSALTKSVYPEQVGGTLGLSASLDSLTRIISPIVAGFLIQAAGAYAPGLLGGGIMLGLSVFIWLQVLFAPDLSCPEPANV